MDASHPLLQSLDTLGNQIKVNSAREKGIIDSINDVLESLNETIKQINNLIKDKLDQLKKTPASPEKDEEIGRLIKMVEDLNGIIDDAKNKIDGINTDIQENGITSNDTSLNLLKGTADEIKRSLELLLNDITNDTVTTKGGKHRRSKSTKRKGGKTRKSKKSKKQKGGWKYKSRSSKRSSRGKSSR